MQCFDSEFAFDLLDKSQAADCNRFRPPRVSHRQVALKELPLSIGNGLVENPPVSRSRTTQLILVNRSPRSVWAVVESHDSRCAPTLQDDRPDLCEPYLNQCTRDSDAGASRFR